jgi:hypothetical protein
MAWTRRDSLIHAPLGAAVHFGRGARLRVGGVFCRFNLVGADADGKAWLLWQDECGAQRRKQWQQGRASHHFARQRCEAMLVCCTVAARLLWRRLASNERLQIDECYETAVLLAQVASRPARGFMRTPAQTQPRASSSSRVPPEARPPARCNAQLPVP